MEILRGILRHNAGREGGLIDRVREKLRFQTEASVLRVFHTVFADCGTVQEIGGVQLDTGTVCKYLHKNSCLGSIG